MLFIRSIFITLILFFSITNNALGLTILKTRTIGWGKIKLYFNSNVNGTYLIQRKEKNTEYKTIASINGNTYTDFSTKPNKIYFYRIKIKNIDVSNNVVVNTTEKQLVMKNRSKKPKWIYKKEFDTENYNFLVIKFNNTYNREYKKRKRFLIQILKNKINNLNYTSREKEIILNTLKNNVNGLSLKISKPYLEKYMYLTRLNNRKKTVAYYLYGIKKNETAKLIKSAYYLAFKKFKKIVLKKDVAQNNGKIYINEINEPGLKVNLLFGVLKSKLKESILSYINLLRRSQGLLSINSENNYSNNTNSGYVFRLDISNNQDKQLKFKNQIPKLIAYLNNPYFLSKKIVDKLRSKNPNILSRNVSKVKISLNLITFSHKAMLKVWLDIN